jgi:hypothetical protein
MRAMGDSPNVAPEQEETPDGINVFFWDWSGYSPDEIEAQQPDGTRLKSVLQLDGKRLGFERPVPRGTLILVRGESLWRPLGHSE